MKRPFFAVFRFASSAGLALLPIALGCSGGDPARPSPVIDKGPHQGALRAVEGAEGFVEVVTEPVRGAESGSPKFRLAVYFLDKNQTGPMVPIPTAVSVIAAWPDAPGPRTIPLTIEPVGGDPAGAAKFVAPAEDHRGAPTGSTRARLGDREIVAPL